MWQQYLSSHHRFTAKMLAATRARWHRNKRRIERTIPHPMVIGNILSKFLRNQDHNTFQYIRPLLRTKHIEQQYIRNGLFAPLTLSTYGHIGPGSISYAPLNSPSLTVPIESECEGEEINTDKPQSNDLVNSQCICYTPRPPSTRSRPGAQPVNTWQSRNTPSF